MAATRPNQDPKPIPNINMSCSEDQIHSDCRSSGRKEHIKKKSMIQYCKVLRPPQKPWVTKDVLDLCDQRRDLKKKRYEAEGAKEYREANRRVQKAVKKAKEDWIGAQCEEIETCLNKNNSKRAYQLVKDLTSEKQGRSSTIQDKSGKCLTEEKEILSRWTEHCSELYNYESCGDNADWTAASPRKKICNQSSVRKLRLQ